MVLVYIMLES